MSKVKLVFIAGFGLMSIVFFTAMAFAMNYKVTYSNDFLDVGTPYAGWVIPLYCLGWASVIATVVTAFLPERLFPHLRTSQPHNPANFNSTE
jgi:hypothetical protein